MFRGEFWWEDYECHSTTIHRVNVMTYLEELLEDETTIIIAEIEKEL